MALFFSHAAANCSSPAMVAACWLGVTGAGSDGPLPVALPHVTGSLRSTPRGSNSTMSKSSSSCGVSDAELVGHVVDTRDAGAAGVDDERPDAGSGLLRRVARHRDGDGRAVRMRVVQRDDEGAALQIAVARGPGHRGDGRLRWWTSWSCCSWSRRRRCVGVGLSRARRAALRATGRHHGSGQDEEEERCSPRRTPGQALHVPFPP